MKGNDFEMNRKIKQILSLLLAAVIFVGVMPMSTVPASAATNGHSQSEAMAWLNSKIGIQIGNGQCPALAREYYSYLGYSVSGNGKDYENNVPNGWTRTYYYSGYVPQPGDIAVWRATNTDAGKIYGHVAIVQSATSSSMTCYEQGYTANYKVRTHGYSYGMVTCFIRPDFNTVTDTIAPTVSNPYVSNISATQFTINCTLNDNVGISRVWLNIYGPSGSDGFSVAASAGSFSYTVNTEKYGGSGWYSVHLYAFDTSENSTRYAFEGIQANCANLGDEFYAYIIKRNSWKHLENSKTGNVQIAAGGNDSNDPRQIWHFIRQSDNSYKIANEYNGYCLDAFNWGTENHTNVGTHIDSGVSAQRWYLVSLGDGNYKIKASYTDLYLDCCDNSDDAGTNIQLYNGYETSAQTFRIYDLINDGINYSKPPEPSSTNIKVSVNSDEVVASWTSVPLNETYDRREYDIRVYDSSDTIILEEFNVNSEYSFKLSQEGKYRVSVSVVNARYSNYFTMIYSDWFNISKQTKNYTVSYNTNGGTGSVASQTKQHDVNLTLSSSKPNGKAFTVSYNANGGGVSASGKTVSQTFTNWNTAKNGSGKTYLPGATYSDNANLTLYAQYSNPSVGTLPTPTRSGYTFDGWYTAKDGGTKVSESLKVTANITLYAHWTKIEQHIPTVKSVKIDDNAEINYKSSYKISSEITAESGVEYTAEWQSSNPKVASVDKNGKVTALKKGTAKITCTVTDSYGNTVYDTCNVTVKYSFGQWLIIILLFGWIWYI